MEVGSWSEAGLGKNLRSYLKKKTKSKKGSGHNSGALHMQETLSAVPSTEKKERKEAKKEGRKKEKKEKRKKEREKKRKKEAVLV
jgi:hypothetical protein